jgi:hypothetical protein
MIPVIMGGVRKCYFWELHDSDQEQYSPHGYYLANVVHAPHLAEATETDQDMVEIDYSGNPSTTTGIYTPEELFKSYIAAKNNEMSQAKWKCRQDAKSVLMVKALEEWKSEYGDDYLPDIDVSMNVEGEHEVCDIFGLLENPDDQVFSGTD